MFNRTGAMCGRSRPGDGVLYRSGYSGSIVKPDVASTRCLHGYSHEEVEVLFDAN